MIKGKCSIVIPTFNRADLLQKILHSISLQSGIDLIHEIIICDSNSEDKTPEKLQESRSFFKDIEIRHLHTSNNISGKRNLGIREAQGEFIIFFDDDCEPDINCIEMHLESLTKSSMVIFSGLIKFPESQVKDDNYIRYRDSRHRHYDNLDQKLYLLTFKEIVTMNMSVRREDLLVNDLFFDESFLSYGMEDNEYGYRAELKGFTLSLSKATITHHDRHDFTSYKKKIFSTARDGTATFLDKYPEAAWSFYFSKLIEPGYPFHSFLSSCSSKLFRLCLMQWLSNFLTIILLKTGRNRLFFLPILYRYILACEYLRGIKQRDHRFKSVDETKDNFYGD